MDLYEYRHYHLSFYAPESSDWEYIVFCPACLFICLSFVNFNRHYYIWIVRDRDLIFDMHTPPMISFQMTPRSMALTLTFVLKIGIFF